MALGNTEDKMARTIDDLAMYDELTRGLPADLKRALIRGDSAEKLYKKYAGVAAVRVIQVLMTEKDSGKTLQAAKELLDRTHGKAVERKYIKHDLEGLEDSALDALILSEASEIGDDDNE